MYLLKNLGYTPILLSVPGLTASIDRPWKIEDYMTWLHDILVKEPEPVILLGHSNGGRISLAFADQFPKKVSSLILIGSAGVYHKGIGITVKRAVFGGLAKIGKAVTVSPFLRKVLYRLARVKDYEKANPIMQETMANLIVVDLVPKLQNITAPTLLIWGAQDRETPLSDGELMARTLPNAKLVVFDDARHSPQLTHPQKVAEEIKKFLDHANL